MTTIQSATQPLPLLADSPLYTAYFAALREGRLTVRRCAACGTLQWPPRDLCGKCQSSNFEVADVPASGEVFTYSVMYRAFQPWFADMLPYGVVVVQVCDGIRVLGRFLGDPETLACGQSVELQIQRSESEAPIVCWRARK